jgi:hypothetical protein
MAVNELDTQDQAEAPAVTGERAEWLESLDKQRNFLRFTARDLTDEQAGKQTTASALCVGGLIKHVTEVSGPGWTSSSTALPARSTSRP